jgi:hypothetical protein
MAKIDPKPTPVDSRIQLQGFQISSKYSSCHARGQIVVRNTNKLFIEINLSSLTTDFTISSRWPKSTQSRLGQGQELNFKACESAQNTPLVMPEDKSLSEIPINFSLKSTYNLSPPISPYRADGQNRPKADSGKAKNSASRLANRLKILL